MTTSEALLAAVLANPADDLPRLVYADYLEENMETERAEFIRVQVELFRIGYQPDGTVRTGCEDDDRRENHLRRRENQLHWLGWREWGKPVSQLVPDGGVIADRIRYRRGFVAEVRCTLSQWCGGEVCEICDGDGDDWQCGHCNNGRTHGIGPAVVRSHPVEVVRVTDREPVTHRYSSDVRGEEVAAASARFWPDMAGIDLVWIHSDRSILEDGHRRAGLTFPVRDHPSIIPGDVMAYYNKRPYKTAEDANAALSVALISWAKSQPHPAHITTSPVAVDVTA